MDSDVNGTKTKTLTKELQKINRTKKTTDSQFQIAPGNGNGYERGRKHIEETHTST